jgi:hypothetical protein
MGARQRESPLGSGWDGGSPEIKGTSSASAWLSKFGRYSRFLAGLRGPTGRNAWRRATVISYPLGSRDTILRGNNMECDYIIGYRRP